MDRKSMDGQVIKDFIGGKIKNEIMYGTSEKINHNAKLMLPTNFDAIIDDVDSGIARRFIKVELKNKFVSKADIDNGKFKGNKNIKVYLKNEKLLKIFENDDDYKLSLFNLILPYCIKYYKKSYTPLPELLEAFKDVCNTNDKLKEVLEEFFVQTDNENDKITKNDLLTYYNMHFKSKVTWPFLLNDVKRLQLQYHHDRQDDGQRGVICYMKLKSVDDDTKPKEEKKLPNLQEVSNTTEEKNKIDIMEKQIKALKKQLEMQKNKNKKKQESEDEESEDEESEEESDESEDDESEDDDSDDSDDSDGSDDEDNDVADVCDDLFGTYKK